MRTLTHYFFIGLILICGVLQAAGDITFPVQSQYLLFKNVITNPGFENGISGYAAVGGGTLSITSTFANVASGKNALAWTSPGSSATLTSPSFTIPAGAYGQQSNLICQIKTSNTGMLLEAYNGSLIGSTVAIPSSSTFTTVTVPFTMPSSGSIQYVITNGSGSSAVYVDDCYIGLPSSGFASPTAYSLVVSTGSPGTVVTNSAFYTITGKMMYLSYTFHQSSGGSAGTGTYKFPLPSGFTINSTFISVGSTPSLASTLGSGTVSTAGTNSSKVVITGFDSSNLVMSFGGESSPLTDVGQGQFDFTNPTLSYSFSAFFPIN